MTRVRLSKGIVEGCPPGPCDRFLWDAEIRGFGVKVTPKGGRSYVLQYRAGGRARRYTIGRHGAPWTVDTARQKARVLLRAVAEGGDPQAERAAAKADVTVTALCDLYVREGLAGCSAHATAAARRNLDNHVKPRLGAVMASQVTAADVDRLFRAVAEEGTLQPDGCRLPGGRQAANAVLSALGAAFYFGVRRGVCRENPARGVAKFRPQRVTRLLSPAEYGRLGRVLATAQATGVPNPVAVGAIRLILLTGLLPSEVLALQWSDVDRIGGRLAIGEGPARWVPVGPAALAAIAALRRAPGEPHLFPGRGRGRRLSDLQPVWAQLRAAASLDGVRLLDLRHSFASLGAVTGDSLITVGRLLGARDPVTLRRYPQSGDISLAAAADRISGDIARLLGGAAAEVAAPAVAEPAAASLLAAVAERRWLDPAAAARRTGLAISTLAAYRLQGTGPEFRRFGGRVRYPQDALEAWLEAQADAPRMGRPPASRRAPHSG